VSDFSEKISLTLTLYLIMNIIRNIFDYFRFEDCVESPKVHGAQFGLKKFEFLYINSNLYI